MVPAPIPAALRRRMKKVLVPLESKEEGKFVTAARGLGWITRKMNGVGNKGWPDQHVALPLGAVAYIEFKRQGEKPRPEQGNQRDVQAALAALGHPVLVAYTAVEALALCEMTIQRRKDEMEALALHGARRAVPAGTRQRGALLKPGTR